MNNFNKHDGNCSISTLDLFSDKLVQDQVIGNVPEIIHPLNSLTGTQVIEFVITGNENFIDLHTLELLLKVKVKNNDNTNLAAGVEIGLINYPIATLFQHVDVYLNNDIVSNTSDYGYKAYLETLLNHGKDAAKSWLQAGGYFKDTQNNMNTLGVANAGFTSRRTLSEGSKTLELTGKVHSDLFNQARLLLNHVDLRLVFSRHNDAFCLLAGAAENVKIEIIDAALKVNRSILASRASNEVESLLQKQDVRYFIDRTVVKSYTYAAGLRDINVRNSVTSRDVPTKIVVGMVSNAAYNGNKTQNPFNFKNYNIVSADITIDSQSVYGKPLISNYGDGQYLQPYMSIHSGMGYTYTDGGCTITRAEYPNGFTLLCADLTATQCNAEYEDPIRSGIMDIALKFSAALPETVNVIVYMQFSNTVSINSSRRAVTNFA
jgi:hypothetical protein